MGNAYLQVVVIIPENYMLFSYFDHKVEHLAKIEKISRK